jgi:hypothetical protein
VTGKRAQCYNWEMCVFVAFFVNSAPIFSNFEVGHNAGGPFHKHLLECIHDIDRKDCFV